MPILKRNSKGEYYTTYNNGTGIKTIHFSDDILLYLKKYSIKIGNELPFDWKSSTEKWQYVKYSTGTVNTKCPICHKPVFYYQNELGSKVYFDHAGPPWPKHPCIIPPNYTNKIKTIQLHVLDIIRKQTKSFIYINPIFINKHEEISIIKLEEIPTNYNLNTTSFFINIDNKCKQVQIIGNTYSYNETFNIIETLTTKDYYDHILLNAECQHCNKKIFYYKDYDGHTTSFLNYSPISEKHTCNKKINPIHDTVELQIINIKESKLSTLFKIKTYNKISKINIPSVEFQDIQEASIFLIYYNNKDYYIFIRSKKTPEMRLVRILDYS